MTTSGSVPTETRWTHMCATTGPSLAMDPARAFCLKIFQTAQQLCPVLLNPQGVVENVGFFFQQENCVVLVSARQSLVADVETTCQAQPSLKAVHRMHATHKNDDNDKPIDVILESALLSLGCCLDLVRPAGLFVGSVSAADWKLARHVLKQSVVQISSACNPDQPLNPLEWGMI